MGHDTTGSSTFPVSVVVSVGGGCVVAAGVVAVEVDCVDSSSCEVAPAGINTRLSFGLSLVYDVVESKDEGVGEDVEGVEVEGGLRAAGWGSTASSERPV